MQITVEQLVHHDESSTEKVSLHRGKFELVEAFWIRYSLDLNRYHVAVLLQIRYNEMHITVTSIWRQA